MYDYNFKENEESILKKATGINVMVDGNYYQTNFVLTEKNLLIFYDVNKGNPIWGVGTNPLPELYVLKSIPVDKANYELVDGNCYLVDEDTNINCYDFDLKTFLSK